MPKSRTKTDKLLIVAAVAGFAASRIIPIPKPVLIIVVTIFGITVLWLCGRALIRRQREKREDQKAAWAAFLRDRNVS